MRGTEQYDKSILVKGHVQDFVKDINFQKKAKGINITLFTPDGISPNDPDAQTVMNFCSNMINPNPKDQKGKEDIDRLIGSALDKILIADNVKSAKDSNAVKSVVGRQIIETNLTKLEDTELDSYIHRATDNHKLRNGNLFGRIF